MRAKGNEPMPVRNTNIAPREPTGEIATYGTKAVLGRGLAADDPRLIFTGRSSSGAAPVPPVHPVCGNGKVDNTIAPYESGGWISICGEKQRVDSVYFKCPMYGQSYVTLNGTKYTFSGYSNVTKPAASGTGPGPYFYGFNNSAWGAVMVRKSLSVSTARGAASLDTYVTSGDFMDNYTNDVVYLHNDLEECDDGNTDNWDGCSSTCEKKTVLQKQCGDTFTLGDGDAAKLGGDVIGLWRVEKSFVPGVGANITLLLSGANYTIPFGKVLREKGYAVRFVSASTSGCSHSAKMRVNKEHGIVLTKQFTLDTYCMPNATGPVNISLDKANITSDTASYYLNGVYTTTDSGNCTGVPGTSYKVHVIGVSRDSVTGVESATLKVTGGDSRWFKAIGGVITYQTQMIVHMQHTTKKSGKCRVSLSKQDYGEMAQGMPYQASTSYSYHLQPGHGSWPVKWQKCKMFYSACVDGQGNEIYPRRSIRACYGPNSFTYGVY